MDVNITPEIKKYLVERIGEAETAKLIHAVKMNRDIMLTGPACTGKTTIHTILFALGYPFVFESNKEDGTDVFAIFFFCCHKLLYMMYLD